MAHIDVDGPTVVRTPFADTLWDLLPCRCVQTQGEYPPQTVPVPPENALLPFHCTERVVGQYDSPSSINRLVVDDIIATALRRFDDRLGTPTWVGGENNSV